MAKLTRTRVVQDQRTDALDMTRTNDSALANLALLARNVYDNDSIIRGGAVVPTDPAAMAVNVEALVAVTDDGLIILDGADAPKTLAIAAADPTNPRIDLVSVGYAEADDTTENRWFRNPSNSEKFQQNTDTQIIADPQFTVTTGAPAVTPTPPATPAGHLVLAQVTVPAGASSIQATDIALAHEDSTPMLQSVSLDSEFALGSTKTLAHVSDTLLQVKTPTARQTLFALSITLMNSSAQNPGATGLHLVQLTLDDAPSGGATVAVVGRADVQLTEQDVAVSAVLIGRVVGPSTGVRTYRLSVSSPTALPKVTIPAGTVNLLAAVTL